MHSPSLPSARGASKTDESRSLKFFMFFIGGADRSCPHLPHFSPLTDVGEEIPALNNAAVKYLKLLE